MRTALEPMSLLDSVRREIWAVDRGVALVMPGTVEGYLEEWGYSRPRFELILFGLFASIGLVLAAIGIFSVLAYSVSLQTREIGIRMALGAQPSAVLKMVIKKGLALIAIGIVFGELASLALTRFIRSELWYVSPHDPITFSGARLACSSSSDWRPASYQLIAQHRSIPSSPCGTNRARPGH